MTQSDLFENTNANAPPNGSSPPKNFSNNVHQEEYSAVSIVANDHVKKERKHRSHRLVNGQIDSSFTVTSSSSSESSSSTSDDDVTLPGATDNQKTHSVVDGGTGDLWTTSNFNASRNTSVWTSGIKTPIQHQQRAAESSTIDLIDDDTQQLTPRSISNSYTLSPIYSHNETDASAHPHRGMPTTSNPIKWRQLSSPPRDPARLSDATPRIDPPPKLMRSHNPLSTTSRPVESSALDDSLFAVTDSSQLFDEQDWSSSCKDSMTLFDPMKFSTSDNTVDSFPSTSTALPTTQFSLSSTANKLFDFQPEAYQRQLRYEPLRKVQAGSWRIPPSEEQSGISKDYQIPSLAKLTLSAASETEADITVGSILDEIGIPPEQFMDEFWDGDTAETMLTRRLSETASDKVTTSSDDVEDPLAVLDSLGGSLLPETSSSKHDWTNHFKPLDEREGINGMRINPISGNSPYSTSLTDNPDSFLSQLSNKPFDQSTNQASPPVTCLCISQSPTNDISATTSFHREDKTRPPELDRFNVGLVTAASSPHATSGDFGAC